MSESLDRFLCSPAGAMALRLLSCARRMVSNINCMDELIRANSGPVNWRNALPFESLLAKIKSPLDSNRCGKTARTSFEKKNPR